MERIGNVLCLFAIIQVFLISSVQCQDPKKCGEPPKIERATISAGGNEVGVQRTYTCNANTKPEGKTTITCGKDGKWTSTDLYCRPSCGTPPTIKYAKISDGDNFEGTARTYSCIANTIAIGKPTILCGKDGKWSKTDFRCIRRMERSSESEDSSLEEFDD